jgi:TolB-like protein
MLLALLLAASPQPLVAVLEFNSTLKGAEREDLDRAYFSDRVRAASLKGLPGVRLMTRENMQVIAQSRGVDLEKCEGLCEVAIGQKLDADYVVSGELRHLAGAYRLTLKLYDVGKAQLLSSEEAAGEKPPALLTDTDRATTALLKPLRPTRLQYAHRNEVTGSYAVVSAQFEVDGSVMYDRTVEGAEVEMRTGFERQLEIPIYEGGVSAGKHQLSVTLKYRGTGSLQGKTFDVESRREIDVEQGSVVTLISTAFAKPSGRPDQRLGVRYEVKSAP